jgi:hypothetical protein
MMNQIDLIQEHQANHREISLVIAKQTGMSVIVPLAGNLV